MNTGHMKGHRTGHLHRAVAYGLVAVTGMLACVLILKAHMQTAALDEQTRSLEASVSSI